MPLRSQGLRLSFRLRGKMSRVYQITEEDLEQVSSLDFSDLGRYYILVAGCIQFVEDEQQALLYQQTLEQAIEAFAEIDRWNDLGYLD